MPDDEITMAIKNAKDNLQPRLARMKEDIDKRYLLEKFVFKDTQGKEHKGIDNVTLNDPRYYADRTISVLGTARRRFEILHQDQELADNTEKFVEHCLIRNDENLAYQTLMPLEDSINFTACIEGTIAARVLLYRDGDKWYPEIMPLDPYSVVYVSGKKGCRIVCIESLRTKEDIEKDYKIKVTGKTGIVQDIWTVDQNIIKIDNNMAEGYPITHSLGMNPVIVVPCPTTPFMTARSDAVKYQAESVYAGVRDMYEELNKGATAWKTQNMMGFLPPVIGIMKPNRKLPKMTYGIASQISLEIGESVTSWPIKDLSVAHQTFFGQIMSRIQRATMSNVDYGDLSFELSALAIKRLESAKDQLFIPRLRAKKFFMVQVASALIQQFIRGGYPTNLEGAGELITDWEPASFKDKTFVINVDYYAESPEENIADMTIANTARSLGLPYEWIYSNLLHLKDVPEIMRMKAREGAMMLSPTVAKYWFATTLKESEEKRDKVISEILLTEAGMTPPEETGGKGVKNPPSQTQIPLGIKAPTVGTPRTEEETIQKEELRRQGILQSRKESTAPRGRT